MDAARALFRRGASEEFQPLGEGTVRPAVIGTALRVAERSGA